MHVCHTMACIMSHFLPGALRLCILQYTINHGCKIFKIYPCEEIPCSETITLRQLNMEESCIVTIQFSDDDNFEIVEHRATTG